MSGTIQKLERQITRLKQEQQQTRQEDVERRKNLRELQNQLAFETAKGFAVIADCSLSGTDDAILKLVGVSVTTETRENGLKITFDEHQQQSCFETSVEASKLFFRLPRNGGTADITIVSGKEDLHVKIWTFADKKEAETLLESMKEKRQQRLAWVMPKKLSDR